MIVALLVTLLTAQKKIDSPLLAKPAIVQKVEQPTVTPVTPPKPVVVCDEKTQWVRADNGECLDKPVEAPVTAVQTQAIQVTVSGNSYGSGQCTWYAKSRRPDLPNNLGNANTWYVYATAAGFNGGLIPRPGAVGVQTGGEYGHVVYVEAVNGDGTIVISEMNYEGLGVVDSRTVAATAFVYIY